MKKDNRRPLMLLAVAAIILLTVSDVAPQELGKDSKGPVGDKSRPVKLLPDLTVSMYFKPTARIATVTVFNKCKGSAPKARVQMTVYYQGAAKGETLMTYKDVPPLAPGAKVEITFEVPANHPVIKTLADKYFTFMVDPFNTVREASEGNNWWKPNEKPFPDKGGYCDPPYKN